MAKRVDSNQSLIVRDLRRVGATVTPTHMVGKGFPDLTVGFRGQTFLLEVKDGNLSPARKRLTPDEKEWHATWAGQVAVVESSEDALRAIGALK